MEMLTDALAAFAKSFSSIFVLLLWIPCIWLIFMVAKNSKWKKVSNRKYTKYKRLRATAVIVLLIQVFLTAHYVQKEAEDQFIKVYFISLMISLLGVGIVSLVPYLFGLSKRQSDPRAAI
jgi:hypothetical protein